MSQQPPPNNANEQPGGTSKGGNLGLPGLSRPTRSSGALEALAQVEASFGGRREVIAQLSELTDERSKRLVQLMTDPARARDPLLTLVADAGYAPSTLLNLLRDASFSRALAAAQIQLGSRLGAVVDRVLDAAEGAVAWCDCTIGGTEDALPTCQKCRGTGKQYRKPSLEHQKMIFEASELLKRGPMVQVNQGVSVQSGPSALDFFDTVVKGLATVTRVAAAPVLAAARHAERPDEVIEGNLIETAAPPDRPDGRVAPDIPLEIPL